MRAPFFILVCLLVAISGCAYSTSTEMYPFGSPMHHVFNGMQFLNMGLNEDAERELSLALSSDPLFSPAYAGKGVYWAIAGYGDISRGYLSLAKKYAKNQSENAFYLLLSMQAELSLNEEGWLKRLRADYDEVVKIEPANSLAHYWMGLGLFKSGDFEEASEKLRRVVELNGKNRKEAEGLLEEAKKNLKGAPE